LTSNFTTVQFTRSSNKRLCY